MMGKDRSELVEGLVQRLDYSTGSGEIGFSDAECWIGLHEDSIFGVLWNC